MLVSWRICYPLFLIGITVACGESPPDFNGAGRRAEPLLGQIDLVAGTPVKPTAGPINVRLGQVDIAGWAVDAQSKAVGSGMYLRVNGAPLACEYGTSRPDVATALHNTGLTFSGYQCYIEKNRLHAGLNTVEPLLLTTDRMYAAGPSVVLNAGSE